MNPWIVAGYVFGYAFLALLALIVLIIAASIVGTLVRLIRFRVRHIKTRELCPRTGDRWTDGGLSLDVMHVSLTGRVTLRTASGWGTWSDTPDEWKRRVRVQKLWRRA